MEFIGFLKKIPQFEINTIIWHSCLKRGNSLHVHSIFHIMIALTRKNRR